MKNDIRNLYWPGLYNVRCVPNCSGSMLEARSRSDKYTNIRPRLPAVTRTENCCQKLGINKFLVVWIENLSNFKHFHISAMSNNRSTADYELAVVTATCPRTESC